jgi:hypothetical protein
MTTDHPKNRFPEHREIRACLGKASLPKVGSFYERWNVRRSPSQALRLPQRKLSVSVKNVSVEQKMFICKVCVTKRNVAEIVPTKFRVNSAE